jgi:hypothetical protein
MAQPGTRMKLAFPLASCMQETARGSNPRFLTDMWVQNERSSF